MFYPWTVDSAAKLGIPRLYFYSASYFSNCASYLVRKHKPHERLVSDTQKFSIPGLPENIEMTTLQLEVWVRSQSSITSYMEAIYESESRSYGALYNSFHELESDYEELYMSTMGFKSWSIGPVSMWVNRNGGEKALAEEPQWLNWLNSKQDESVLYVSFGRLPYAQLVEIAHGLEILVIISSGSLGVRVEMKRDSFLDSFDQRMKESNKGFIIWNWAPQLLILNHPATGGIVTHCGWNSILESLSAGLPMITWPLFAEQFYNAKLLVDVLKIRVPVGVKENKYWIDLGEEDAVVKREEIVKAVELLIGSGEESKEMRRRARKLGDASKRAIEKGGSSHNNLKQLIDELKSLEKSSALKKTNLDD